MAWLTDISIRRPVFIVMVTLALVVLGLTAAGRMHLELNPKIEYPLVSVITPYPGAGPEEIESQVTKRIEDAAANADGVKTLTSSSQEGVSAVSIRFEYGVSIDAAASDIREKVGAVRGDLPPEAKEPIVQKFDINAQPILMYCLTGPGSSRALRDIADNIVKPGLSKIEGVGAVTVSGGDTREISVGVRQEKLDLNCIPIGQIVERLHASNLNRPSGHITSGGTETDIRVVGEFPDVRTLAETRLTPPESKPVRLSDVADVRDTVAERSEISRIDGADAITIAIQKTGGANTCDVAQRVRAEAASLPGALPQGIRLSLFQDDSTTVRDNVRDVTVSLFLGAALAILVVYLFLHSVRGTAIIALSIPTSILATFIPMALLGFTLNTITLLALSLSVGILVDDSIVVLESIERHLAKGVAPADAARIGRSEIGLAAIVITLVDVVVFVPIAFMSGVTGQFFRPFGITVACATLFSLFVSFTLTPMLAARWLRPHGVERPHLLDGLYACLERLYRRLLAKALEAPALVVYLSACALMLVLALVAASLAPEEITRALPFVIVLMLAWGASLVRRHRLIGIAAATGGVSAIVVAAIIGAHAGRPLLLYRFTTDEDQGQLQINGETAAGTSLAAAARVAQKVEAVVRSMPDVDRFHTEIGASSVGARGLTDAGPQYFTLRVKLREKASLLDCITPGAGKEGLRVRTDTETARELRERLASVSGTTRLKTSVVTGFQGIGKPIQIDITGRSRSELATLGARVLTILKSIPGVINADTTLRARRPEQRVIVDREKAALYGISIADVATALHTAYEGDDSVQYRENGNEYPVRVRFAEEDRHDPALLHRVVLRYALSSGSGPTPVILDAVSTVSRTTGPARLDRRDRQELVSVSADVAPGYAPGNLQRTIEQRLKSVQFGTNAWQWDGELQVQQDESGFIFGALGMAVALVYMLMAALFDNLLSPLVIMVALPQAIIGALVSLMLAGQALTVVAMTGIIMLVGLVAKNAILLVDYTNTLRSRGLTRRAALLESGPTRLRPILMTTIAMVCGMLPTAIGLGRGAGFRAPLAIPVVGGLILSTLLTLLVIPCVYVGLPGKEGGAP